MKTTTTALDTHLRSEVTSLTTCWRIVRTDGVEFGFTAHDQDLLIDGLLYESAHGYTSSAIAANSDLSVDNSEVEGVLDSERIKDSDLRNGLFNFAQIFVFMVNWQDLSQGVLRLRRGWFGEVTLGQNGKFTTELRGLTQAMSHNYIETFTPECRADFCDSRCKLTISDYENDATILEVINQRQFRITELPPTEGTTTVGAHRYWRVVVTANISQEHTGFAEFKAWDQSDAEITGGTPWATSDEKNYEERRARDGNPNTYWSSDNVNMGEGTYPIGHVWRIDFGSPKNVKTFAITSSPVLSENPTAFRFEYSDNNENWTLALSCAAPFTKTGQTLIWGIGSETGDPLNVTDGLATVPPPHTGVSSYKGGTCRFIAGQNSGRAIEIMDFDEATSMATLFEPLPYPPVVGDTLKIAQGCDKRRETCIQYGNIINFRGEPFVPGQDEFMRYPDAKG